jgi:hypothetical protein
MLRFAVHRLGNHIASPRSYRMPCGKVSSRVHVGVTGEGAGSAPEDGLALARFPVHVPAGTATLTGVRRVEHLDAAWGLLVQTADEQPPPGGEYLAIQPSLLTHAVPRVASGPPSAFGHVLDGQALDTDQIETARQIGTDLSELPALLKVTRSIRPPWAPPGVLFAGKVPHEPRMGAMFPQYCLVGTRREQAVAGHTKTLSNIADIPEEVKRRLVHCSQRQVTTPRTV